MKQLRHVSIKIAKLSVASLLSFFSDEKKYLVAEKEENHLNSDHVEAFSYQQGVLRGKVHARSRFRESDELAR